jgi:demethylmenaquinone methyltransferase / 2-methoxy-6-polyprenyl-1,4-benzoquinol methylase
MKQPRRIQEPRNQIRGMFDAIAFRYDFVNRVLSLRRDIAWRRALVAALPQKGGLHVLDLATGTCDVLLALQGPGSPVTHVVGADVSGAMLRYGQEKIARAGLSSSSPLIQTDAASLCFPEDTFDVVTVAFGVRNYSDLEKGLREMQRVLHPGGSVLILEFSMPSNPIFRVGYLFYFRHILPRIAGMLSRQPGAYHYLNRSVEAFPYGRAFCDLLHEAGFVNATARPLTFGIATLYVADKSA